jgi:hypothetical protein
MCIMAEIFSGTFLGALSSPSHVRLHETRSFQKRAAAGEISQGLDWSEEKYNNTMKAEEI